MASSCNWRARARYQGTPLDRPATVQETSAYSMSGSAAQEKSEQQHKPMTDLSELYNARILELAASIGAARRLADPDATASAHSKLCGSTIVIDLKMDGGRVTDFAQSVKACLLGQTSAAIMGREIVGSTAAELREVGARMRRMLKEGGDPPDGRWSDLAVLEPVREIRSRHASTLLVFDAVEKALDSIEAKAAAAQG
jgi:NifU-like protein involved in Fe-S cluster formation